MVKKVFQIGLYRNQDKSINLVEAFKNKYEEVIVLKEDLDKAFTYLIAIESIQPIISKQLAASCLVQAAVYIQIDEYSL